MRLHLPVVTQKISYSENRIVLLIAGGDGGGGGGGIGTYYLCLQFTYLRHTLFTKGVTT